MQNNSSALDEIKLQYLMARYSRHYCEFMDSFTFYWENITFELLQDFSTWYMVAYEELPFSDKDEKMIVFTREKGELQ